MNKNNNTGVLILGKDPDIIEELMSDLVVLGFDPKSVDYPDIKVEDIVNDSPDIIILDFTVFNFYELTSFEKLISEDTIPPGISLVALVSRKSLRQIPLDYSFDEIVTYPYETSELSYRLRRLTHLNDRILTEDTLHIGNLSISPSRYEVKVDGQSIPFSHKEYELFKFLFTHPSHVFTREELFVTIWGNSNLGESRTVDVHIRRIRAKIGDNDQTYIKTVRGVGYTLRFENN
ncbi:MAG: response regulator transcription factor [Dehalococcoidales bacterium]|nr:response regulator transcription factor [Dehalococcoidales bacterium]